MFAYGLEPDKEVAGMKRFIKICSLLLAAVFFSACASNTTSSSGVNGSSRTTANEGSGRRTATSDESEDAEKDFAREPVETPLSGDDNEVASSPSPSDELYSHGKRCTIDCSGHDAGYEWAERKGISDASDCGGKSQSFIEGCESYAEENGSSERLDRENDADEDND